MRYTIVLKVYLNSGVWGTVHNYTMDGEVSYSEPEVMFNCCRAPYPAEDSAEDGLLVRPEATL